MSCIVYLSLVLWVIGFGYATMAGRPGAYVRWWPKTAKRLLTWLLRKSPSAIAPVLKWGWHAIDFIVTVAVRALIHLGKVMPHIAGRVRRMLRGSFARLQRSIATSANHVRAIIRQVTGVIGAAIASCCRLFRRLFRRRNRRDDTTNSQERG